MMTAAYRTIVQNSFRHLWRKKAFWVIQGLLSLGPVVISIIIYLADPNTWITLGTSVPGTFTLALNYLVLPFLVTSVILDDFGKIGEILWSGPLDNLVYFVGRFSGLWLALAAGTLMQIGGWFLASLLWLSLLTEWVWLVSLAIYLLANTLALSMLFLLAVLLRRIMPVMLGWAVLWVYFYYTVSFAEGLTEEFYPMISTAYINIFFHNMLLSPSLGLGLTQSHFIGMFAWFLGVSLVAFSLALWISPLVDRRRAVRFGWFAPVLAGAALLAAFGGYALNQYGITSHVVQPSPRSPQIDAWEVVRQHTEVDVDASRGFLSGSAVFELAPAPDAAIEHPEIVLRLNAGLDLTAASDADGKALTAERVGDSMVISLPEVPQSPFTLNLAWKGRLQIPFTAFEQPWKWYDAPDNYGFIYMPQPLKALIQPNGGYILRDGDWMPWPWTTQPHQARDNYLEIRPQGAEAAASIPLVDGAAVWTGEIPEGLLVFLPGKKFGAGGTTLAISPLAGRQHMERAGLYAGAAAKLADLFNVEPPEFVVVLPYLSKLIWSGDLLLIPDGSGYYIDRSLSWLYRHDVTNPQKHEAFSRAVLASLARVYLIDQMAPAPLEFEALMKPAGENTRKAYPAGMKEKVWVEGNGRWVQAAEYFDTRTIYNPRWSMTLRPQGEWSCVAFWLAMEMADEGTRQADLAALESMENEGRPGDDRSNRYDTMRKRIMPEIIDTPTSEDIILQLHAMAERIGSEEVLTLLAATLQETRPETVTQLLAEMEQRSENLNIEVQP